ncbi:MAG: hypothetical protein OYH76_18370, partial [Defluviicoccus sp.]|nr:hypothetical protein [Defluviicoccus sp.]MDE0277864.1 hypothetical protein [Defluviicoccus sp.]
ATAPTMPMSAKPHYGIYIDRMSDEILTMLGVGIALGLFIWRVTDRLDRKIDALAQDRRSLARELSELRGEIRGRLGDLPAGSGAA